MQSNRRRWSIGVGGDFLTTSQLIRQTVSEAQLYKVMPDVEEKDLAFRAEIEAVRTKTLREQVAYWTEAFNGGEFGPNSPKRFWKTDYEAYEQLMALGRQAIPLIREQLKGEWKAETRLTLELVLEDLEQS